LIESIRVIRAIRGFPIFVLFVIFVILVVKKLSAQLLIVLERDGHWAAALRRELDFAGVRATVSETRSWDEVWQALGQSPTALVAAELTEAAAGRLLAALARVERRHPQAAIVVLADRRLAPYRDLLREAGALHYITSPRRLSEIADIVRRRAARFESAAGPAGPLEEIRANLPWVESE
jgi:DNA-binding NarL/FixJ family response regulator